MTSNAGAHELTKRRMGFDDEGEKVGDPKSALDRTFSPEFRNRLDRIVVFKSLPPDIILQVAGKMLLELEAQLAERDVHFTFSDAAALSLSNVTKKTLTNDVCISLNHITKLCFATIYLAFVCPNTA